MYAKLPYRNVLRLNKNLNFPALPFKTHVYIKKKHNVLCGTIVLLELKKGEVGQCVKKGALVKFKQF